MVLIEQLASDLVHVEVNSYDLNDSTMMMYIEWVVDVVDDDDHHHV